MINRVTAASMEPRGSVGDYKPTDDRYTIYTTLQRTHPFRAELAQPMLKVPENKVRVVAGDIGGSLRHEVGDLQRGRAGAAGVEAHRPAGEVDVSTRSEAFLSDAQARDNVTDAELALDKDGNFLGVRVKTLANVGAYLQIGMPAVHRQYRHARRRLSHAGDACRRRPRCSPTPIRCGPIAATAGRRLPM